MGNNVTKIYLNNTPEFTGSKDPNGKGERKKFFVNDYYFDQDINYLNDLDSDFYNAVSLSDIIAHELGHALGLVHHDDKNGNSLCPPDINTGLMNTSTKSNIPRIGLQQDDKCQFVKLYCPSLLSVENESDFHENNSFYYTQETIQLEFKLEGNSPRGAWHGAMWGAVAVEAVENGSLSSKNRRKRIAAAAGGAVAGSLYAGLTP